MASVKRVEYKSGRVVYRIVICQGYDKKGNKLVKNLTYSVNQSATPKQQEREAKKYAMDMEDKLKYGYDYNAEKMSFEDFAYKWLESVKDNIAYGTYAGYKQALESRIIPYFKGYNEYSCAMKSHFRKIGNQMSGSGNHLCKVTLALIYPSHKPHAWICHAQHQCL